MQTLAQEIETTNSERMKTEKNVSDIRDALRWVVRALVKAVAYTEYTKNLFPPPKFISVEIAKQLDTLSGFAYTDPKQRDAEIQGILAAIKQAENPPTATPNAVPSATH